MKYIDAEKLIAEVERRKELLTPHKGQGVILFREINKQFDSLLSFIDTISQPIMKDDIIDEIRVEIERRFSEYNHDSNHHIQAAECASILDFLDTLQQEQTDMGEVSDGYHTFNELYYYRMLYNAAFFNLLPKEWVHKSKRHHTGEECFGGGWFIVMANLPTGQISNHYELKDWDLFQVPEKEFADEWDGHTPQEVAERLHKYLMQEQPEVELEKEIDEWLKAGPITDTRYDDYCDDDIQVTARHFYELGLNTRKEE